MGKIVLIFFGIMLLFLAYLIGRKKMLILKNGMRVSAKIVDVESKSSLGKSENGGWAKYPVLQYKVDGKEVRCHYDVGEQFLDRKSIGKEVKIAYDKTNPKEVIIINDYGFYIGLIFLVLTGFICFILAFTIV